MLTPSSARCTACVANTPPQIVRFPRAAPASAPAASSPAPPVRRPYHETTPAQRQQVMVLVRGILRAAYPFLEERQWVQALDDLQLPLYTTGEEAFLYAKGLTTLVQYLAAYFPTVPVTSRSASPTPAPAEATPPVPEPLVKQTYAIRAALAEQLDRVSYWKRKPRTWFVNQALTHWLDQYPEAHTSLPEE